MVIELCVEGHQMSAGTVRLSLHDVRYPLQAPAKANEGASHPDGDAQFRYLRDQISAPLEAGEPVISVGTEKKGLVGSRASRDREWQPGGSR